MVGTQINEFPLVLEHVIDNARDFVSSCNDGFGRSQTGTLPAIIGSQPTITVGKRLRRQAEGRIGSILGLFGPASEDFASGNIVVGSQAHPRGEMAACSPWLHIYACFRKHHLDGSGVTAINGG
jgi:hypothetical protein